MPEIGHLPYMYLTMGSKFAWPRRKAVLGLSGSTDGDQIQSTGKLLGNGKRKVT